ncbi:MAG: copper amine oxidase N-terminal domain-containing protein, partial [Firmicutes bacterium]|nr:copper amine oxidase N-terminal domain-containing protein [Bacillota bacterium]
MQKLGLRGAVLLFVLAVLMAVPAAETGMVAAAAAGTMPAPALLVDGRPATPAVPLFWDEGTVLVSLRDLGAFLGAGLQWNGAAKTAWIQKYGHTVFFRLQTDEVLKNGKVVAAPAAARLVGGTVYVPLRFVAENLGAAVAWEGGAR